MENLQIKVNSLNFEHIGWKYYKSLKKKAMEQKFSAGGLLIVLSIAFFIVIITAFCLGMIYHLIGKT
jgi:hypothetical protein